MGPAIAASKKHEVKNFPWNWTAFVMKPQEGIGKPFGPLRRGPYHSSTCHWSIRQSKTSNPSW
jgi:hypothetical protein